MECHCTMITVGIAVGCALLVVILSIVNVVVCCIKRRKPAEEESAGSYDDRGVKREIINKIVPIIDLLFRLNREPKAPCNNAK